MNANQQRISKEIIEIFNQNDGRINDDIIRLEIKYENEYNDYRNAFRELLYSGKIIHEGDNFYRLLNQDDAKTETLPTKTPKRYISKIISNPWVITIIGGLIIAGLAKLFGWV